VPKAMAEHDLFFFPTHGENFGHVINEALSVGTPVLISNRTPWRDLEERQAGWDLSLSNEEKIINVVEFCCSMPSQEFFKYNKGAYSFIASSVKSTGAIEANRKIFKEAYHLPGDNGGNKKMKVTYYQRKPLGNQYSIERVFEAVREALPEEVTYKVFLCPFQSKGIIRRMLNCLAAIFFQGDINHITGDVHYLALLLSKKKTVLTIHDCRSLNRLKGLRRKIFKLFWFDIPIKRSSIVTAISSFTKQELLEQVHCPEEKIIVVPDPVTKGFAFKPKRFNENNPVILQIGTGSNKNLERVVQACEGLDVTLDVVGKLTNEQKTLLEEKAIRYSNSYNLSDYEIKQKYENCDIVVFASIYEGFGMPILEAQATGRPVITSNIEPMKEVAGEGAYLVDPYDVQEIRQGISRICQDASLRKRIIKKGHDNIKYFTSMTIAKQYVDIYKKITKGSL
ncbi:MAG: glycosyltransferase, partial [Candidatus Cloacimonadia bacterium]